MLSTVISSILRHILGLQKQILNLNYLNLIGRQWMMMLYSTIRYIGCSDCFITRQSANKPRAAFLVVCCHLIRGRLPGERSTSQCLFCSAAVAGSTNKVDHVCSCGCKTNKK